MVVARRRDDEGTERIARRPASLARIPRASGRLLVACSSKSSALSTRHFFFVKRDFFLSYDGNNNTWP